MHGCMCGHVQVQVRASMRLHTAMHGCMCKHAHARMPERARVPTLPTCTQLCMSIVSAHAHASACACVCEARKGGSVSACKRVPAPKCAHAHEHMGT